MITSQKDIKNAAVICGVIIEPLVFCGRCFSAMKIDYWCVHNGLVYPDSNSGHECQNCGHYYMPSSGLHGDLIVELEGVQFFSDKENDLLHN